MSKVIDALVKLGRKIYKVHPVFNAAGEFVGEIISLEPCANTKRANYGYIRVSTWNQETNDSLVIQTKLCWNCNVIFWEVGSGKTANRPVYLKLLDCMFYHQKRTVQVNYLNRLSRDPVEICRITDVCIYKSCGIVHNSLLWNISPTTKPLLYSEISIQYSDLLIAMQSLKDNSEARQAGIVRRKKRKGKYPGRKSTLTKALYNKYLKLKKKHPNWLDKEFYYEMNISKSTFFRLRTKFEKI